MVQSIRSLLVLLLLLSLSVSEISSAVTTISTTKSTTGTTKSTTTSSSNPDCDPNTLSSDDYPAILTKIDVVLTSPVTLRAHFRLLNSTKEITFEGVVYATFSTYYSTIQNFDSVPALVACRSMGCSKLSAASYVSWISNPTCRFTCPDGTSALQQCRYIQRNWNCPADAMNLKECVNEAFWLQGMGDFNNLKSAAIVCTECGDL